MNIIAKALFDGNSLLMLRINSLRIQFLDSFKYLPMSLSAFIKRYVEQRFFYGNSVIKYLIFLYRFPSIDASYAKGFFPYKAIHPDWYDYEGNIPDIKYFGCSDQNKKDVEQFIAEYGSARWNWKESIHTYLTKDVKLLTAGLCCFVAEFAEFQDSFDENRPNHFIHPFSPPYLTVNTII